MVFFNDIETGQTIAEEPDAVRRLERRHRGGMSVQRQRFQALRHILSSQWLRIAALRDEKFIFADLARRIATPQNRGI